MNDDRPNVLLVDDRPENLLALEATLGDLGLNLVKARSGREALGHLLGDDFAAILLDVQMPGMDGFEAATQIRRRERSGHTPIIFVTAIGIEEELVARGYEVGAMDYLVKPFPPEALRVKVLGMVAQFRERVALEERLPAALREQRADILLVDDHPENLLAMVEALRDLGENLVTARSGREALRLLLKGEFALALLDVRMPDMDGFELAGMIRGNRRVRDTQIIFTTAVHKAVEDVSRGYALGAVDYLFTPFAPDILRSKVRALVDLVKRKKLLEREVREIDRLNRDLRRSEADLRRLNETLEQRVAARTEALQKGEEKFRDLFENAPVGYCELDTKGDIVQVNRTYLDMLGYSREEMVAHSVWEFIVDREASRQGFAAKIAGMLSVDQPFERTVRCKDGEKVHGLVKDRLLRDAEGKVTGIRSGVQDVTERKRAEEALRESEEHLNAIFDAVPDGILLAEVESTRFRAANPSICRMLGYSREQMLNLGVSDIYLEEEGPRILHDFERHSKGDRTVSAEVTLKRKDGSLFFADFSSARVTLEGKACLVGILRDVTERKRGEEERIRLSMAVEQAGESITITNVDGIIVYVNPAFERVTGYSREEAIGQNPRILKSGKHDAEFYRAMWSTLLRGEVWSGHFINKRKDGSLFEVEAVISPVCNQTGEVINYVAVKHDVTQEVALEQQLFQAQKMEAVGTLAGGVAHDFNNELTGIIGFAQLALLEEDLSPKVRDCIARIPELGMRAARLISQLLTFSRRAVVEKIPMSLLPLAKETVKMLERTVPESIAIRLNAPGEVSTINADPTQMQQVLMNLCVNASQAMPGPGEMTISLMDVGLDEEYCRQYHDAQPGDYVCLSVRDTGMGMTPEVQAHIFEPFYTTKGTGEGTGLGLATVYGIVKTHEGHVNVYSEVGIGSEFKVYLPAMQGKTTRQAISPEERPAGGTETLLLVEDQDAVLVVGQKMLERLGYTVLPAGNGEEAVDVYRDRQAEIALVLTDKVMPKMGGDALYEALRQINPAVKVLMTSGYSMREEVDDLRSKGLKGFVQKPLEFNSLGRAVRKALDEKA